MRVNFRRDEQDLLDLFYPVDPVHPVKKISWTGFTRFTGFLLLFLSEHGVSHYASLVLQSDGKDWKNETLCQYRWAKVSNQLWGDRKSPFSKGGFRGILMVTRS